MSMIGALHAAGFGRAADYELKKRKRDEQNLTGVPFSQQINAARSMAAGTEYGDGRRAGSYQVRLHSAKHLTCDSLLKELFFPTLTIGKRFGFCSTTGIDAKGVGLSGSNGSDQPVVWSKAGGVYRGIAMFTLRSHVLENGDPSKLDSNPQQVGTSMVTGYNKWIYSAYRRFNNGPVLLNPSGTGSVVGPNMKGPTVTNNQFDYSTSPPSAHPPQNIYVAEVGNINELETKAVQSVNFQHAVGAATSSEGTTAIGVEGGSDANTNWDGTGAVVNGASKYYANLKNTTIRISDGYLEMDITNGKATSTFIEVVIHAHKKHSSAVSTQQLLDAIHNSVQYQQTDRNVSAYYDNTSSHQQPGGWQAFWDPTYPLLAVKSQHRKAVDDIAREVHRSNHMLGPGQSKTIKILLGSLYYDLGSKCVASTHDGTATAPNTPLQFDNPATGVGALNISIGHSGVQQLSAPVNPEGGALSPQFKNYPDTYDATTEVHTHSGAGFWVGKAFCPSEIVVNGNYVEKFYPAYVVDKERRNWSDRPMLPPYNPDGQAYPTALPVTDIVGTVSLSGSAIPTQITSQNNEL